MSGQFPIQVYQHYGPRSERRFVQNELSSIPWDLIAPHEDQAERNHGQTLKRLAERCGLSSCEAVAVIEDRRWHLMDPQEAADRLRQLVEQFSGSTQKVNPTP